MQRLMARTWRAGAAGLVALAFIAAGCGSSGSGAATTASGGADATGGAGTTGGADTTGSGAGAAPVTIKFGLFGALSDAGLFIAKDRGYFKQENITVKFVPSGTAEQVISLVAGGQMDAAGIAPTPGFFNAITRGVDVRLVADKGQIGPGHSWVGVVVRKDLYDSGEVKSVADLKGRKVAITGVGTSTGAEFAKLLEQNGLSIDDVQIQPGNPAVALTALINKAVDAAVLQEPFIALSAVKNAGQEIAPLGPVVPNGQNGAIAVGEKLAGEPDVLARFMTAYRKGVADYAAAFPAQGKKGRGQAAIEQILIKNTQVKTPSLYAKMQPVLFSPDGSVDTASIDYFQKFFVDQGLQQKVVPASQYVLTVPAGQG